MAAAPLDLPILTDGVVLLRPFSDTDAAALAEIWRDPEIRARNTVPDPTTDAACAWVALSAARAATGEQWEWAIVDAATDGLAGRMALKDVDRVHRRASVATWVAPAFRGRRLAARSVRLTAAHVFDHGLVRVHAECETDNVASRRMLEAAGMRHEGTLRAWYVTEDGVALDLHVFGMLPEDLARAPALPG